MTPYLDVALRSISQNMKRYQKIRLKSRNTSFVFLEYLRKPHLYKNLYWKIPSRQKVFENNAFPILSSCSSQKNVRYSTRELFESWVIEIWDSRSRACFFFLPCLVLFHSHIGDGQDWTQELDRMSRSN